MPITGKSFEMKMKKIFSKNQVTNILLKNYVFRFCIKPYFRKKRLYILHKFENNTRYSCNESTKYDIRKNYFLKPNKKSHINFEKPILRYTVWYDRKLFFPKKKGQTEMPINFQKMPIKMLTLELIFFKLLIPEPNK